MRWSRRRRLAWLGTLALVAALSLVMRDAAMTDARVLRGGLLVAAIAAIVGAVALIIAHVRGPRPRGRHAGTA